jgi:outer membrane protein assembly factor BamB
MLNGPRLQIRLCFLMLILNANGWMHQAAAQFEGRFQTEEIFVLAPRSLQRMLVEGKTAIQEARYAEGISALGAILQEDSAEVAEDLRGQDFFLARPVRGNYNQSVKGEAIALLNQLPPEGRRVLELQFGVKARLLLDAAIAGRDFDAISDVARQYPHTDAGYDALLILAQWKLTEGYPLMAADILQTLLDYPAARQRLGVQLAYAAAVAWQQAGNGSRAASTLSLAARDFPGQSLTVRGRQWSLDQWQEILSALSGKTDSRTDKNVENWMTVGGSPARNATSKIGLPLANERWEWFIHSSRPEGMALREMEEKLRKSDSVVLPKLELRTVDNTVISRSNDSALVGIDLDSGMLTWRRSSAGGVAPLKRLAWESGDKTLSNELLGRVWGSTAFGRISSDSQRCYQVVQTPGEAEVARGMVAETNNRLEGISISRQGAIVWSIGGEDGDEPELATAYFLGPPLPYGGQLYCLVEINGEVELVVLDPETGRLQWRQQLATVPAVSVKSDRSRQAHSLTPSISDGVVVCPTGIGGIVAVDLLTRSLRWGTLYQVVGQGRGGMGFPGGVFGGLDYDPMQSRWYDEALMIDSGVVVVTPPESDILLCFDLLSGELIHSRKRGRAVYVAGLDSNRLIIAYPSSLLAMDLKRKQTVWEVVFPSGLTLAGKGVWQDGGLLLPLTDNQLIQVDLTDGKIVGQARVALPLGNLFAHQGQLLSVGSTSITAYHTRTELERQVAERLSSNPDDIWALNHRSQLLLSDGKIREALEQLLIAYDKHPSNDDTRYFLADTMLVGLRNDFQQFSPFARQLDSIVRSTPQQWIQYLQLLAKGSLEQGDYLAAFDRLWEMVKERHSAFVSGALFRTSDLQLSNHHRVDLDTWLSTELGRCFADCSESERAQMHQAISAELDRLKVTIQPVKKQLLRFLCQTPVSDEENFQLVDSLLRRGEQTAGEQILSWLRFSRNVESRQQALSWMSRENQWDESLAAGISLAAERTTEINPLWRKGIVSHRTADEAIYSIGRPIEVMSERFGRPPISIAVSDRSLALSDHDGNPVYNFAFRQATSDLTGTFMRSEIHGGLILVETVSELVAFDFYRGFDRDTGQSLLWRFSFDGTTPQETFQPAHMFLSTDEPLGIQIQRRKADNRKYAAVGPLTAFTKIVQVGNSIVGLDPYTGRRLWSRDGYPDLVRFSGSPEHHDLIVVNPSAGETQWIDARDGKLMRTSDYLVKEILEAMENKQTNSWNHWYSYRDWQVDYRVQESGSKVLLRIWNPREEQIFFEQALPKNSRVTQSNGHLIVAVDPAGVLTVVDLDKCSWHQHEVEVNRELANIHVIPFTGYAVVLTNRTANSQRLMPSQADLLANGLAYGIDLTTGNLAWSAPGRLINASVPMLQPKNSPFMVAYQSTVGKNGSMSTSIVLMDVRSGEVVDMINGLNVSEARAFSMRLRPQRSEVAIALGEKNFIFRVSEQPRPPEPVINFGAGPTRSQPMIKDESSLFQ